MKMEIYARGYRPNTGSLRSGVITYHQENLTAKAHKAHKGKKKV
jgi:hypothetical protein